MEEGWIKIHRRLLGWEWADDGNMMNVWIHLLLNAAYEESRWHGHTIGRGQVVISLSKFCEECGVSMRTLRTCLERLETLEQIKKQTTNKFTIVTICKYEDYQLLEGSERQTNDKQTTNKRQTKLIENDKQTTSTTDSSTEGCDTLDNAERQTNDKQDVAKTTTYKEIRNNNNIYNISLSCAQEVQLLGVYWNEHQFLIHHIPKIDQSNPERMYRTAKMVEQYGLERLKTAVDIIERNNWLHTNVTFDWVFTRPDRIEKILSGYYNQFKTPNNNTNGNHTQQHNNGLVCTDTDQPTGWEQ